jgi:anti-sigma regulatory factor (Ser/Thr protein kinase)
MVLPARAENVAVVRHAVAALAEGLGMVEPSLGDLKTVVTEACMNVVVHAYPDEEDGLLEVEAAEDNGGVTVLVRDRGRGIRPRPDLDRPSLRIGLTLIAALSSSFEISGGTGRGTEISMHLQLSAPAEPTDSHPDGVPDRAPGDSTKIRLGPPELVGPVLGRVVAALAARHRITVDRLSDAMLLSDAISARAPEGFTDGHVSLSIADRPEGVELRVGPMRSGAAARLRETFELPEVGSLATLADDLRVEEGGEGDFLVVGIAALSP